MFGNLPAQALTIQYGSSVNPDNTVALINAQGIDELLISANSLNADQFLAIIHTGYSESIARG